MTENKSIDSILVAPRTESAFDVIEALSRDVGLSQESTSKALAALRLPRANILSDFPTNEDILDFGVLVRTISSIIFSENTQTPLTICVDGEWGSGKTSVLKMIEAHAKTVDFPCIWLNAWNLGDIVAAVDKEMIREFSLSEENLPNLLSDPYWSTSGLEFGDFVDKLLEWKNLQDARLVVFVDDLDRAFPEQINQVLSSLKLILESSNCVFVVAMDIDVVARSLARSHIRESFRNSSQWMTINVEESSSLTIDGGLYLNSVSKEEKAKIVEDFGYKFLEKIIQIKMKVPSLRVSLIPKYLRKLNVAEEIIEIVQAAPEQEILNPRRLKHYLNWLSVSLQLIVALPIPSSVTNLSALWAIFLKSDYRNIYDDLLQCDSTDDCLPSSLIEKYPLALQPILTKLSKLELIEFETFLEEMPIFNLERTLKIDR